MRDFARLTFCYDEIFARHNSPGHIRRTRASPAINAMTVDQSDRPALQHVSCPAANTSPSELHKIRLAHFNHESTHLCKATARNVFMVIRALLALVARIYFDSVDRAGFRSHRCGVSQWRPQANRGTKINQCGGNRLVNHTWRDKQKHSNRRVLRSYFFRFPALHAFAKGCQHRLAVDSSWFRHHEPGGQDISQRGDIECSVGGDLSDCVGRRPGYVERKAEGQRARKTIAGFNRLRPSMTAAPQESFHEPVITYKTSF